MYLVEERAKEKGLAELGQDREAATDIERSQGKNVVIVICSKVFSFPLFRDKQGGRLRSEPRRTQHSFLQQNGLIQPFHLLSLNLLCFGRLQEI